MSNFLAFELTVVAQVTAITLAAVALTGVFVRQAAMRHAIGATGLFLVLASPMLAIAWPRPSWLALLETRPTSLAAERPRSPEGVGPDRPVVRSAPSVDAAVVSQTAPAEIGDAAESPAYAVPDSHRETAAVAPRQVLSSRLHDWRTLAMLAGNLAWGAGVVWLVSRRGRSRCGLNHLHRSLETWPSRPTFRDEDRICRELGLKQLPPIMLSDLAPIPLVLGTCRPVVVLPKALAKTATAEQLRTIVIHEVAHIARRDPWILVAQRTAQTIFWWHPGVYRLNRHISRSREDLCDNHVLRRSDATGYAEMLLELAERRPMPLVLGLFSARWSLEKRIVGLLDPGRETATETRRGRVPALAFSMLALSALVGGLGGFKTLAAEPSPPQVKAADARQAGADVQQAAATLKKITVRGTCVDDDAAPIAGARVRIFRYPSPLDPPLLVADLRTDEDGRFIAQEVDTAIDQTNFHGTGDLCVAATADERVSMVKRVANELVDNKADEAELSLVLKGDPGTLSGTVTDDAGRPIPGVKVFLSSGFQEPLPGILSAVTDDAGRYAITGLQRWQAGDVVEGGKADKREALVIQSRNFLLDHPGYARTMAQFTAVPLTVDVTLNTPAIVEGDVVDAVIDWPATNVVVSAQGIGHSGWYQTRTDRKGHYVLRMTKDHYNIWAEADDRIAIAAKAIEAEPGKAISIGDITLVRGGFVSGQVIDAATNEPVKPAEKQRLRVAHYGPARPRTGAAVTSTVVNADGTYRLRVAPGENYIYLMNGKGSSTVTVEDGEEVSLDLTDLQLANQIRQGALAEDRQRADQAALAAGALKKRAFRKRADTPAGRLLDKLERQNAGAELFKDAWCRTLRAIVNLGPAAVPELVEEIDATPDDKMLRCMGFVLRAIGDERAVPALIRAIPKTLRPPGSDMGLVAEDAALIKFAQQSDLDPMDQGNRYTFGRPVREIFGALQSLTGQNFGEEQLYHIFLDGLPSQRQMKRKLYQRTAQAWAEWWETVEIGDPQYARVNLPEFAEEKAEEPLPPGMHLKTNNIGSGRILESVLNPKSKTVFYDFDTGRASDLPERWRTAENIEPHLDDIVTWAIGEGFDLMGVEYVTPNDAERVFALRSIGLRAWELDGSWKKRYDDVTLEALQADGRPANGLLLHYDKQSSSLDPKAIATFLYITREGTPGLLFVGVEVQDDSLKPGGRASGDTEMRPIGFRKGRRFGVSNFEEVQEAIRGGAATQPVERERR